MTARIVRHARSHGADGTDPISVASGILAEDLATAITDTTKVLAPDGAGGVHFRAETGGGGSLTIELLDASGAVTGVTTLRADAFTDNGGGDVSLFPQITGPAGTGALDFTGHARLIDNAVTPTIGVDLQALGLAIFSEHTAGALAGQGLLLEAGVDYVGFWLSEKDATTMQLYAWDPGGFDFELVDRGTHHWKLVATDGGVAIPALGMLPQYSTAPSSPVEGQSYWDLTLHKARSWDGTAWQNWW